MFASLTLAKLRMRCLLRPPAGSAGRLPGRREHFPVGSGRGVHAAHGPASDLPSPPEAVGWLRSCTSRAGGDQATRADA